MLPLTKDRPVSTRDPQALDIKILATDLDGTLLPLTWKSSIQPATDKRVEVKSPAQNMASSSPAHEGANPDWPVRGDANRAPNAGDAVSEVPRPASSSSDTTRSWVNSRVTLVTEWDALEFLRFISRSVPNAVSATVPDHFSRDCLPSPQSASPQSANPQWTCEPTHAMSTNSAMASEPTDRRDESPVPTRSGDHAKEWGNHPSGMPPDDPRIRSSQGAEQKPSELPLAASVPTRPRGVDETVDIRDSVRPSNASESSTNQPSAPKQLTTVEPELQENRFSENRFHEQPRFDTQQLEAIQPETLQPETNLQFVFVTGRHYQSVCELLQTERLPEPFAIICDVGTSLYHRTPTSYQLCQSYVNHLESRVNGTTAMELATKVPSSPWIQLQESEKQSRFKLSYYCPAEQLDSERTRLADWLLEAAIPYEPLASIDPFTGEGLLDLLPREVNKSYALHWYAEQRGWPADQIVFAGDSGNDVAALTSHFRAIVVANANDHTVECVETYHRKKGSLSKVCFAEQDATLGVVEGLKFHGWLQGAFRLGPSPIDV